MAQSAMALLPLGVNLNWDKGHQLELDWEKCLATVKLVIMVKDNMQADKLLRTKPEREELDYPQERTTKCQKKDMLAKCMHGQKNKDR